MRDQLASSAHFGLGFKKLRLAVVTFKRGFEYFVNARIGRNRAHEVLNLALAKQKLGVAHTVARSNKRLYVFFRVV